MTGHASMETAIEAVRLGAFDYITKPCKLTEIEAILRKVAEKRELKQQEPGPADAASRRPKGRPSWSATRRRWRAVHRLHRHASRRPTRPC